MEKTEKKENRYGLLGKDISYSFSKGYFTRKFKELKLDNYSYENFDLADISKFKRLLSENTIRGLNVTIPYKEQIIPFLTELDGTAKIIGAVNTIKITENGLKGYNTDFYGFQKSIEPYIKKHHTKALILGTGGASKAISFVFKELGISYSYVSRTKKNDYLIYEELDKETIETHTVIVNCTPLGTFPNINEKPSIPYKFLNNRHFLFDLIYNPEKTAFLKEGEKMEASICNGLKMLQLQAEKAWGIWNAK
ncbi:shikimate dehydrogenase [Flagellimonas sp. HMM57]|uniref:shikimate dehydrogenase family protein n=1 Tax=unclassified Flagellimonas TaxID=2644544 RepID=UPI0013D16DA9|nr:MULTISPECIES: shikimate dehydrogenase [unclassified Flagellimonas]UII75254.1 shikimate dehydrogenase [Flagellimonas sp. HMM57]